MLLVSLHLSIETLFFVDAGKHNLSLDKEKTPTLFISLHVGPKYSTVLYKMAIYNCQNVYMQEDEDTNSFSS